MKRTWYNFKAKTANTPTVLSIYDDIGAHGVRAVSFLAVLRQQAGPVEIEISSLGGSVIEGIALFNGMKSWAQIPGNSLTFTVMGVAASIASMLIMVPNAKVRMPANTYLMMHKPWASPDGNADELREIADLLDKMEPSLINAYVARSGKTDDEIRAMLSAETWLTADEALAAGFVDEVIDAVEISNSCDVDRLPDEIRALIGPVAEDDKDGDQSNDGDTTTEAKPFADEALAVLDAAGLKDVAAPLILACADLTEVKARVDAAREIKALCAVAKRDGDAKSLIAQNKSVADVRAHLIAALAAEDERSEIDNTPNDKSPRGTQPAAVSTDSIWAARRKQQGA